MKKNKLLKINTLKKVTLLVSNLFFVLSFSYTAIAQTSTPTPPTTTPTAVNPSAYGTQTIQTEADRICAEYTGFKSVYGSAGVGGGGSVPVDLTQLRPVLESIDRNTQLTANETRALNVIRFCEEYQNMAKASNRLAADTAKELKNLNDNCYTDKTCVLNRVLDADKTKEIEKAQKIPIVGREVAKLILKIGDPKKEESQTYNYKLIQECDDAYKQGRSPDKCLLVPKVEDVVLETYEEASGRIENNQNNLSDEFARGNGIIASRPCTKTASGKDPSTIKFYEADCISYRTDPLLINQESLKQIVSLPYTQAYSPSSILGADQVIGNINTRVRDGNLSDPNMSGNFGPGSGAGSGNGGGGVSNIKGLEENYKKLLTNVGVITNLYDVARLAYASSTSVCKNLPVQTRSATIAKIDSTKKTYTDYKGDLTAKWEAANKTPNENHNDLILQVNFDLKDKINQTLINKVYDSVKALLQTCVDSGK